MALHLFRNPTCDECGKFAKLGGGASTAEIFDLVGMQPDYTRVRCAKCTAELGPVKSNARPADGDMRPYQDRHW